MRTTTPRGTHSRKRLEETLVDLGPWHFDIEVAPGVRTVDFNKESYASTDRERVASIDPYEMVDLFKAVLPTGVSGKTFLDVGCNGGGYCFVAHELGARACQGFDVRDHWIRQAECVKSLKYPEADSLRFFVEDVTEFAHQRRHDVTLFKGVFYHLPDPIATLNKICALTERAIIVDSASRSDIPADCIAPVQESKTHLMSGVHGLAWFPGGPEAVRPILAWSGFPHMRVVFDRKGHESQRFRGRFRLIATREESDLASYDASTPGVQGKDVRASIGGTVRTGGDDDDEGR